MTKGQAALMETFLSSLDVGMRGLYGEILSCLSENGYSPHRVRSSIVFKHGLHNKQIAKMGMKGSKEKSPYFALRFSACRGYPKRFDDIVKDAVTRYPSKAPQCLGGACGFCAGDPEGHVYTHVDADGEAKSHCGAYVLEIPDITRDDIGGIKALISEEHVYLLKHEAVTA